MKKFIRKPDVIEVTTWEEFIKYGLEVCTDSADGMPWAFEWNGRAVTHENDEKYIVANYHKDDTEEKEGQFSVIMTPDCVLVYRQTEDGFGDVDLMDLDDYEAISEVYEEYIPEKKTFFSIMADMHANDIKNNTGFIAMCPDLVGAEYSNKLGTKVTMGAAGNIVFDLQRKKLIPRLILIDYEEFNKVKDGK